MALTSNTAIVHAMYIAYYQRPADPAGLDYWLDQINLNGAWQSVAAAFANAPESQALYGDLSLEDQIAAIYRSSFEREAAQSEIDFWANSGFSSVDIAFAIVNGAQNQDLVTLNNKIAFSQEFVNQLDPDGDATGPFEFNYSGSEGEAFGRKILENIDASSEVNPETVAEAIDDVFFSAGQTFTLKEVMSEGTSGTAPVTEVYWGYMPNGSGDQNINEGIPVGELLNFLTTITGLDLTELGLVDDDGVGPFDNVTNLTLGDVFQDDGSNGTLTIEFADGTSINTEAVLGEEYMSFLNNLLFDADGNSRLFEKVVVEGSEGTDPESQALVLTTAQNNGSTEDFAFTTNKDDLIVAGRLDLLHGAFIDAGEGYNTLEIDAKGHFAQPKALLNIQQVNVQNLPNIYTDEDGNYIYPDVTEDNYDSDYQSSIVDLSRAVDLEALTITEGNYDDIISGIGLGDLTVVGIRNGAVTTLDGNFTQDVTIHFSSLQGEGIQLVFNNVSIGDNEDADLNVAHNAQEMTIETTGGNSYLASGEFGGLLNLLTITGTEHLFIEGDLDSSFQDDTPVTIDASANTGGVDLNLSDSDNVTFIGSQANDRFEVEASESVTIEGGVGDNVLTAEAETVVVNVADGKNSITTDDSGNVTITTGDGDNVISSVRGESVSVSTGDGDNAVTVSADEIAISTGSGSDNIVVSGMGLGELGDANVFPAATALLNIDTGTGEDTVVLGRDVFFEGGQFFGVTALEGSSISGENITLFVENPSDLRAAELSGIQNVVLNHDISDSINEDVEDYALAPVLTLTDAQFAAIGAENFSTVGSIFNTYSQLKIIITESTSLTALGVDDLPSNVDLQLELQDGVQLTLTAQQLHEKVAPQGITLANDNNTDQLAGSVLITGAGTNFDPFNNNDQVRTTIDSTVYYGGSLSDDFVRDNANLSDGVQRAEWGYNVLVDRTLNGYDRPADAPSYSRLTIDSDEQGGELGPFSTLETFLRFIGDSDLEFTPMQGGIDDWGRPIEGGSAIALGIDNGVPTNEFMVDFSSMSGELTGLTLANFENADAMYGNGGARVNVEISEDQSVASSDAGLVSRGISTYVVTDIYEEGGSDTAQFWTSRVTQDLEVLGLQGNYDDTITFGNTERGVTFLMEVEYDKFDGYAVGSLVTDFAREGGTAVVDVVNIDAPMPSGEVAKVAGINVTDAVSATINVVGGNTIIESFDGSSALVDLTLTADANLEMAEELPGDLSSVDASGVVGELTATVDLWQEGDNGPLTFVGAAGGTELTIDDAAEGAIASIDGAGIVNLTIGDGAGSDNVDLTETTLSNIGTVTLNEGSTLSVTFDQADAITPANFIYEGADGAATLNLVGLNDQVFALADYPEGLDVTLTLAELPTVTLNPLTDLTGISGLVIPEGTTLFLTMEQFQQLDDEGTLTGLGSVVITDVTQASVGDNGEDLDLSAINLTGDDSTVSLNLTESVDLSAADVSGPAVDTYNIGEFTLTLGEIDDADGVAVIGDAGSVLKFIDTDEPILSQIDASGFDVDFLEVEAALVADNNVDFMFEGLVERVTKVIVDEFGQVVGRIQNVVIEAGVTVPGALSFNDYRLDNEVTTLNVTLAGGVLLDGDLIVSTVEPEPGLIANYLQELNIVSEGTEANTINGETNNIITGDITPLAPFPGFGGSADNNLKVLNITATQNLVIEGDVIFSSHGSDGVGENEPNDGVTANDDNDATVTLNIDGDADVTVEQLDMSDEDIGSLVINNNGTGTLTVTGASPAIVTGPDSESVFVNGTGNVVLGDDDLTTSNTGIDSGSLSLFDASGLSGNLSAGEFADVDSAAFSFIAGTGVTTMTLTDDNLDSTGVDSIPGNNDDTAGWNIDFSNAAVGSEFHLAPDWVPADFVDGSVLNIDMGPNATLFIDETVDLSGLDLTILSAQPIVVADGVTLTLSAEQANGLTIVGENGADSTGVVNIVNLNESPTDLSGISEDIAGVATLELDDPMVPEIADVTLDVTTDLGFFTVQLEAVEGGDEVLSGQTIRFTTVEQAEREVTVVNEEGGAVVLTNVNSTNVVWLFENLSGSPIDTSGYFEAGDYQIGRLWLNDNLIANEGGDIEGLFTTLPNTIIRAEFADVDLLNALLAAQAVDRIFEVVSFLDLGDISFNDMGIEPDEFIQSLTVKLGGQSSIDSITLDDALAPNTDPDSVVFTTLDIESHRSLSDDYFLATEFYTNNNDGVGEAGENVLPMNINTIGDISAGNGLELLEVNIDTLDDSVALEDSGSVVGDDPGAELEIGTISFNSNEAGASATVTVVTGSENDVTIKALDASNPNVTVANLINNGLANATITGGSPAFNGGAAAGNTEEFNIETITGNVTLGTAFDDVNSVPFAGIAGEELSLVSVLTTDGDVDLGTIAQIDSSDDTDPDTLMVTDAFTLDVTSAGAGVITARLGAANVNGVVTAPELNADSTWVFSANDPAKLALTITEDVLINAGGTLVFNNVDIIIEGDVDLTMANIVISGTTTISVPEGNSLALTPTQLAQGDMVDITGSGELNVVGDDLDGIIDTTHILTVNVDLSDATTDAATLVTELDIFGAVDDAGDDAGFNVTGSAEDDVVLGSVLDDTFTMGLGDDTITGFAGNDTYNVDAGTDTIVDLEADPVADALEPWFEQDVLVVSTGATALATVSDEFVATADTTNDGTATLTAADGGEVLIDVSLAGGANGFTLVGNTDDTNTLIGSEQDDDITSGDAAQVGRDFLTGNGGNDNFGFVVDISDPLATEQATPTPGVDNELYDIALVAPITDEDGVGQSLQVNYTNNALTAVVSIPDDATVDFADIDSIGAAVAARLSLAGVATVYDADNDQLAVTGTPGQSVEINSFTFVDGGAVDGGNITVAEAGTSDDNDVAQVSTVTIGAAPGDLAVDGEIYSVTINTAAGNSFEVEVTASGDTAATIAGALEDEFDLILGGSNVTADVVDNVITFTATNADLGGFTVELASIGGVEGTSASLLLTGTELTDIGGVDGADIITDFTTGEDTISLGLIAGDGTSYESAVQQASYADAYALANTELDDGATYFLTSIAVADAAALGLDAQLDDGDELGLLFFDANGDGEADGVIGLVGVNESNFAAADIIV